MSEHPDTFNMLDDDGQKAPYTVRRLCWKIAEQAGKASWWNAMAYAAELIVVCQKGCRDELSRTRPASPT